LKQAKFSADAIHSDLEQNEREQVLTRFKHRQLSILVATDIVSRGIDIDNINLVINYDVPHDGEDYVHRIGRTARAETDGIAYTFVSETEQRKLAAIERLLGEEVPKGIVPEQFGDTPAYQPNLSRRPEQRNKKGSSGKQRPQGNRSGNDGRKPQGDRPAGEPRPPRPQATANPEVVAQPTTAVAPTAAAIGPDGAPIVKKRRNKRRKPKTKSEE